MTKIPALGVAISISFFCIAAAQSMPLDRFNKRRLT